MSHVYWESHEIPIPVEAHINSCDGRVFLLQKIDNSKIYKRLVIGRATSDTHMHPNSLFKVLFPERWMSYYGTKSLLPNEISCGLYVVCLSIVHKTELYKCLIDIFGSLYANAIIDFAIYSIKYNTNVAETFCDKMQNQMVFSDRIYSDSWYSDLFEKLLAEEKDIKFRKKWLSICEKNNKRSAWVSIDGSNNECSIEHSNLVEKGHSKSGKNKPLVSFIYAVDSEIGMPLTYNVNNGSMIDSKAFFRIQNELDESKIHFEGVILDRGFYSDSIITELKNNNTDFILMLKENTQSYIEMINEHKEIKWRMSNSIERENTFSITSYKRIFKNSKNEAYINLYFNGNKALKDITKFCNDIKNAYKEVCNNIANGNNNIKIEKRIEKFIEIIDVDGEKLVDFRDDICFSEIEKKGFYCIASSQNFGSEKVDKIYHLRDASERQYKVMKSHLGFNATHVHSTNSLLSKYFICFIASIIRNEIQRTSKIIGINTDEILVKLDRIKLILKDDLYVPIFDLSEELKNFLRYFDLSQSSLVFFANDYNNRLTSSIKSQPRSLPVTLSKIKKEDSSNCDNFSQQCRRGREKGSKNHKTIAREQLLRTLGRILLDKVYNLLDKDPHEANEAYRIACEFSLLIPEDKKEKPPQKAHKGRTKGIKNRKTIEYEQLVRTLKEILFDKAYNLLDKDQHEAEEVFRIACEFLSPVPKDRKKHLPQKPHKGRKKGVRNHKTIAYEQLLSTLREILFNKAYNLLDTPDAEEIFRIACEFLPPDPKNKEKLLSQKDHKGRKKGTKNRKTVEQQLLRTFVEILFNKVYNLIDKEIPDAEEAFNIACEFLPPVPKAKIENT